MIKNSINKNYNGEQIKDNEVLVPIMYDEAFAKAYCKNTDCIKTIKVGGRKFKVMYIAIDKCCEKAAKSSFNLAVNEALGHYYIKDSVSLDYCKDEYDLDLARIPSPEEEQKSKENQREYIDKVITLLSQLIEKSPKLGLATLLLIDNVKGKKFQEELKLAHDAANTVRRKAEEYITQGLDNIDINNINVKKSKNYEYHKERAYQLLDTIIALYLEA